MAAPITAGFLFICSGAARQLSDLSILSTLSGEMGGTACHETGTSKFPPLFPEVDLGHRALVYSNSPSATESVPSTQQTPPPRATVYSDEEKKANDSPDFPALLSPSHPTTGWEYFSTSVTQVDD